ncbi:MAG: PSD1 and planctomycete cytochrome C domain-containing protein [Phycisphaeraceae bacterium]|nr:PSD1 and planctomycete cytochrome C domain-containing protein [Phycisphaeraceae bacterium]
MAALSVALVIVLAWRASAPGLNPYGPECAVVIPAVADQDVEARVDFSSQVLPILSDNCFACHGVDEKARAADLRLDQRESAVDEALAIEPGDAAASLLIERILSEDRSEVMPPPKANKQLDPEEIEILKRWIDQGAEYAPHWAFVKPVQAALPEVRRAGWPVNEVDRFVLTKLEASGVSPADEADKRTLIRRVTLDLTGLPPAPEAVEAFVADTSPDAYEKVVDRLLASPRYGEHMTRYWLDAVRYGDTHGLHLDNYRSIWPYRDWIIAAFNENMPFDQFTIEQLAGDLLEDATRDQLVASGYNRCNVTTSEGGSIKEEVYTRNVIDRVETTGTVWLGLTTGCASCHDHKYDPITQKEFYELFAFFNSLDADPMDNNRADHAPALRLHDEATVEKLAELDLRLANAESALAAATKQAEAALEAWLADPGEVQDEAIQKLLAVSADERKPDQVKGLREHYLKSVDAEYPKRLAERDAVKKKHQQVEQASPVTLIYRETKEPRKAYVLERGLYDQKRDEVQRDVPDFLPTMGDGLSRDRLGFAQWLVSRDHPLTARVTVNRFWQQLFGVGLVKTSEDFGVQGEQPSHPALLDWLAVQFVEDGWDVKQTMKRLVMSATYRQSAAADPQAYKEDPENRLLARGPRLRLDAEVLRDQVLAVSGLMNEQIGGASVKPPQPAGIWKAVGYESSNTANFKADTGDKVYRRSMYVFWKRTAPAPFLVGFDAPNRESCVVRRERTNTAMQALIALNEPQYVESARRLGERVMLEAEGGLDQQIAWLLSRTLMREPTDKELAILVAGYEEQIAFYRADLEAAKALIATGTSKPDDKLDPAALAAWTMTASTVINLDEFINKP